MISKFEMEERGSYRDEFVNNMVKFFWVSVLIILMFLISVEGALAWSFNLSAYTSNTQGVNNIWYERNTRDTYSYTNTPLDAFGGGDGRWVFASCGEYTGSIHTQSYSTDKTYFHASGCNSWMGFNWNYTNLTRSYVNFTIIGREAYVGQGSTVDISLVKVNSSGASVIDTRTLYDNAATWSYSVNANTLFNPGDRFIFAVDDGSDSTYYDDINLDTILLTGVKVVDYFSITAVDLFNETISNFCVEIYKSATLIENSCTTTGTLTTSILSNDASYYSLFPTNISGSKGNYIGTISGNDPYNNQKFLVTPSTDPLFVMTGFYQANISFNPRTLVTNQSIPFNSSEVILYHVSGDYDINLTEALTTADSYSTGLQLVPSFRPAYIKDVNFQHKISEATRTSDAYVRFTYNDSTTADSSVFSTSSTSYVTQTAINPNPGKAVTLIELRHKISAATSTSSVVNLTYERYSKLNRDNNLVLISQNGSVSQKTFMDFPGYLSNSFNYSLSDLTTTTLTEYFYQSVLNVSVFNGFTNLLITNWTGNITHISSGWSTNINSSNNLVNLFNFGDYLVYVESPGYAVSNEDNYKNVTVFASNQNVNLSLYSNNSVRVYVKDEATNTLITELINIFISGSSYGDSNYSTSNGTLYIDNLPDGTYNFKFSGENYTLRNYIITVADRSTQQLTAILSKSTSIVTFTVLDDLTSAPIEGASMEMYRLFINNSLSLIESTLSDITGRAQFSYTPNIKYKFVISKTGYITKEFELNPVIFNSYNVRLQKTSQSFSDQHQMVSVDFTPKRFFDELFTPFNIYFRTVNGTFIYYNYTLVLPDGTTYSDFGNESQGQGFLVNINITGARYNDYVNFTYFYNSTLAREYTRFVQIPVLNGTNTNTFIYNIRETYGLGIFERALITMLIVAVVGGIATLIAGSLAGIGLGLLLTGYFAYIGFVPIWGSVIVLFVGFLFLSRREM